MEVSFASRDVLAAICLTVTLVTAGFIACLAQAVERAEKEKKSAAGFVIAAVALAITITAPAAFSWLWLLHGIITSAK